MAHVWQPLMVEFQPLVPVPHFPLNILTATLHYENCPHTPCLLHYFHPPLCDSAVAWFTWVASQRSHHFIRVLSLLDKRHEAYPYVIVVTEFREHTLRSWSVTNYDRMLQIEVEGRLPRLSTKLASLLRGSFEALTYLWDLGFTHGNTTLDNIFTVDGAPKLGIFEYNSPVSDLHQLDNMVTGLLPYQLFPDELTWLLDSITVGQCMSNVVNAKQWRSNVARLSAKNPAFKSAIAKQKQMEAAYYKLARMRDEELLLYENVCNEMVLRLDENYNWVKAIQQQYPEGHYLRDMVDYSTYTFDEPFMFAKYGRHLKVHKPPHLSHSQVETALDSIIDGYLSIIFEVLSGFGIDIDE